MWMVFQRILAGVGRALRRPWEARGADALRQARRAQQTPRAQVQRAQLTRPTQPTQAR